MKIRKNGKVIKLTESDLRRIVKKTMINEQMPNLEGIQKQLTDCLIKKGFENPKLITKIPQACFKLSKGGNDMLTKASLSMECGVGIGEKIAKGEITTEEIKSVMECLKIDIPNPF